MAQGMRFAKGWLTRRSRPKGSLERAMFTIGRSRPSLPTFISIIDCFVSVWF